MAKETEKELEKKLTPEEYMRELVPYTAPLVEGEDDYSVTVNGETTLLMRGEPVMIPRFVYKAIIDSERQKVVAKKIQKQHEI